MQTQYASTQTNQTAILHSCLKCTFPSWIFFLYHFVTPSFIADPPMMKNSDQRGAFTFWLWADKTLPDTVSLFVL